MTDRTLFLAQEIACMYVDDFLNLPIVPAPRNVVEGVPEAVERMNALFELTH